MSNELVIRDVNPDDVGTLCEIAVAAWRPIFASFRQMLGDELFEVVCAGWQEDKARQVRRACDPTDSTLVCVAERDGQVVGFITFHADAGSSLGQIGNNAVHPDFQGQGIGPRMYQHACERMRGLGVRFVKVMTGLDPSHAPARRAYEKAGFSIQMSWVDYYRKL